MSDSDSSNDFLLSLPWVVSSRLQAAGNDVLKRAKLTELRIYVAAEVEEVQ